VNALHDLSDYLNTSQRLSLETSKTRIISTEKFLEQYFSEPEDQERQEQELAKQELQSFVNQYSQEMVLDKKQLNQLTRKTLVKLLDQCLSEPPLNLGVSRYILRRATQLRTDILLPVVFEHLEALIPVMRDVARYLKVAIKPKHTTQYGNRLEELLNLGAFSDLPFVRMWGIEIILNSPLLLDSTKALQLSETYKTDLGLRAVAQIAQLYNQQDWVREHKETWRSYNEWDRRAIIMSAQVLPIDEKRHWLGQIIGTAEGIEKAVARYVSLKFHTEN
jgi:hypothetical protein